MSGTLALASTIASLDREALTTLVRGRRIAAPAQVVDPIDLAAELLKHDSIAHALAGLTRNELADLDAVSAGDDAVDLAPLTRLGLIARTSTSGAPVSLPEVTAALEAGLVARGITRESLGSDVVPVNLTGSEANETESRGWYAPALAATAQLAWVLRELERTPAKMNRGGTIASTWLKSFEERVRVAQVDQLLRLLRSAGLLSPQGAETTPRARAWLASGHEERWIAVAEAAIDSAPPQLINTILACELGAAPCLDGSEAVAVALSHRFPLIEETTRTNALRTVELWQRLGIVFEGRLSPAGRAAVEGLDPEPHIDFPAVASGVYIQPDLSVVVPGPLSAADEREIASLTVPEQIGVASTLRITESSLGEAFDRGADIEELRTTLERLSLTGIPQPLAYLITSLGERAGSVIVSEHHGDSGRSRIDFARAELRAMIQVDRSLAHLQLHETPEHDRVPEGAVPHTGVEPLYSRLRADHVLAALVDARYPARSLRLMSVAADPHPPHATPPPQATPAVEPGPDPIELLIDRVLEAAADGPGDTVRQLTLAIRHRRAVRVTVEVRGERREFTLTPVSLSAGRMRALDEAAGVERTFPLDAITEVRPPEANNHT